VKVVGVISGSTEVQTLIGGSSAPNEPTTSAVQNTLTTNQQSVMVGLGTVAPVLSIDSSYHADPSVIVPSQ
jgi:outer membrane lipopolysaccharide assembly protein LptE/RlpB